MGNCLCFKSRGGPTEVVASSEEYKLFGNQLFKQQKYEEAAVQYSKAIKINNKVSVYFSNRALCYYKLKKYHQAFEDGNSGYVIDNNNLKALILCIKSKASEALQGNLENFEHSLKYCEFFNYSSMADSNKEYCESLTRKIKSLFKFVEAKEKKTKLIQYYSKILPKDTYTKLIQLFSNESEQMESCICPLTMEFFHNPVTVSSGYTYENNMVLALLKNNNLVDPLTRQTFRKDAIYKNESIKSAVEWFSEIHPEIVFMTDSKDIEI